MTQSNNATIIFNQPHKSSDISTYYQKTDNGTLDQLKFEFENNGTYFQLANPKRWYE